MALGSMASRISAATDSPMTHISSRTGSTAADSSASSQSELVPCTTRSATRTSRIRTKLQPTVATTTMNSCTSQMRGSGEIWK